MKKLISGIEYDTERNEEIATHDAVEIGEDEWSFSLRKTATGQFYFRKSIG
jgi:hypothetical protein